MRNELLSGREASRLLGFILGNGARPLILEIPRAVPMVSPRSEPITELIPLCGRQATQRRPFLTANSEPTEVSEDPGHSVGFATAWDPAKPFFGSNAAFLQPMSANQCL
jgi:hypothetical protein